MKSVHILSSAASVVNRLQRYLTFKDYNVLSVNQGEGEIHAAKKRIFRKDLLVDFKVRGVDSHVTSLKLSVRSDERRADTYKERIEEKLLDSIEKFW